MSSYQKLLAKKNSLKIELEKTRRFIDLLERESQKIGTTKFDATKLFAARKRLIDDDLGKELICNLKKVSK